MGEGRGEASPGLRQGEGWVFSTRGTWVLTVVVTCNAHHRVEGDSIALQGADGRDPRAFEGQRLKSGVRVRRGEKAGSGALKPRMWKAPVAQGCVARQAERLQALNEE